LVCGAPEPPQVKSGIQVHTDRLRGKKGVVVMDNRFTEGRDMKKIKCIQCGTEMPKKTPACPSCGERNKVAGHLSGVEVVLMLIPVGFMFWWLANRDQTNVAKEATPTPVEQTISSDRYITGSNYFGCIEKDRHNRIFAMIVQNDTKAFTKALGAAIPSGACVVLKQGQKVFLDDVEITTGLIKIRPEGEVTSYWAIREVIK
jgi:RecJ-like exonuclease